MAVFQNTVIDFVHFKKKFINETLHFFWFLLSVTFVFECISWPALHVMLYLSNHHFPNLNLLLIFLLVTIFLAGYMLRRIINSFHIWNLCFVRMSYWKTVRGFFVCIRKVIFICNKVLYHIRVMCHYLRWCITVRKSKSCFLVFVLIVLFLFNADYFPQEESPALSR